MAKYVCISLFYFCVIFLLNNSTTDSQQVGKTGKALMNVGINQCITNAEQVTGLGKNGNGVLRHMKLAPCSVGQTGYHANRFVLEETEFNGNFLEIVEQTSNYSRNSTKKSCLYTGFGRLDTLWTDLCDLWNEWQGWDLEKLDDSTNGEFLLYHRASGRCAKVIRSEIRFLKGCNKNDKKMRWKFVEI